MNTALQDNSREFQMMDSDYTFISDLIYQHTGIVLEDKKRDMVYGRVSRRLRALDINDFKSYCQLLQQANNEEELLQLINAITTNLTRFFRERHHLDHLHETLKNLSNNKQDRIRIWSAGCSSGMEPYSIAMVMHDAIPHIKRTDAKILATDIDTGMIAHGIQGVYKLDDIEGIDNKYKAMTDTQPDGQSVQMQDKLQELISFKQLNLMHQWPMKGPFDAIFCRNVVIYFDTETKHRIFRRMAELLKPGGFLYIGHSESMKDIDEFTLIGQTIYQRVV